MNSLPALPVLWKQLSTCMLVDRHGLKKSLNQVKTLSEQQKPTEKLLQEIAHKIRTSQQKYQQRLHLLPQVEYPLELPVSSRREEISAAIHAHQVVIVCGETGSGKTTQLPKICLALGRGVAGFIGHTQPRRIAARSVASRIAQELKSPLGEAVGYKVRFNDKLSDTSYIKLMTDGILLAETQGDRFLNAYDTLIIDEAHERSLNIDFLLGYLKQLLPKRPDLKVIVTSATIDAEGFSRHFNDAPVIEVSGRTYPVEVRYRPLSRAPQRFTEDLSQNAVLDLDEVMGSASENIMGVTRRDKMESRWLEEDDEEEALEDGIIHAAEDLLRHGDGDILVFLPGEREIRDVADHLRKYQGHSARLKQIEVLPLFARLSIEDQQKIFRNHTIRRIVLATNVAETSLTVPGIKYVIDTGLARVNRYSPRAKVEQLQIEKISQAAAKQRAGRCGRVSHGICVRLYAEEDFNSRPVFTEPEILRSSLAAVILRMSALRLGDVAQFPFIEAPSSRLIADGYQLLQELGAVDSSRQITELGLQLAKLPLDPRVARMVVAAKKENCLREILIIASVLSIQDPRERPMDKRDAADAAHAKFAGEGSDFMTYLKLWDFFDHALRNKQSNKDLLNQCHRHFLSSLRLKEWRELHGQILQLIDEMGFKLNTIEASFEQIHKALLAGLLGNIGFRDGENESYVGARGIRFHLVPKSGLKKARPKWVMAAELMETQKLYARCVAKIEPDWIEPLARGLTESHYSDPRWDRKMGQVQAWERVVLYGLTIIAKRRVHYGPINPAQSREIFIREALVFGDFDTRAAFFSANERLIAEVEELEHKARRQDVLVDEQQLFAFYDARIPADIFNAISFEKWREMAERNQPKLLFLTRDDLMRHGAEAITVVQFPEKMLLNGLELALKYRFEPGHVLDGVTATVPLALLNQLNVVPTEWLVPGMLREKLSYLIKALPKTLRRVCVPVPEFVTTFLERNKVGEEAIKVVLARHIQQVTGLKIGLEDWTEEIPAHLQMNFSVVDGVGRELATGRDWNLLKKQLGSAAQLTFRNTSPTIEKKDLKQWDFGDLPQTLSFEREGVKVTGYPALEDAHTSVSVKLFDTAREAVDSHRQGVCRLMRFELSAHMKQLDKGLVNFNQYALILRGVMTPEALREDMIGAIADRAFIGEDTLPRTQVEFTQLKQRARTRLPAVSEAIARQAQAIATEYQQLTIKQSQLPATAHRLKRDVEQQLGYLLYPGCFSKTPWGQLQHLPRYLKALRLRLEKYSGNQERDGKHAASVAVLWQKWQDRVNALVSAHVPVPQDLQDYRWLIEELRVSLFAQELKTPFPVSFKRLEKVWQDLHNGAV